MGRRERSVRRTERGTERSSPVPTSPRDAPASTSATSRHRLSTECRPTRERGSIHRRVPRASFAISFQSLQLAVARAGRSRRRTFCPREPTLPADERLRFPGSVSRFDPGARPLPRVVGRERTWRESVARDQLWQLDAGGQRLGQPARRRRSREARSVGRQRSLRRVGRRTRPRSHATPAVLIFDSARTFQSSSRVYFSRGGFFFCCQLVTVWVVFRFWVSLSLCLFYHMLSLSLSLSPPGSFAFDTRIALKRNGHFFDFFP